MSSKNFVSKSLNTKHINNSSKPFYDQRTNTSYYNQNTLQYSPGTRSPSNHNFSKVGTNSNLTKARHLIDKDKSQKRHLRKIMSKQAI